MREHIDRKMFHVEILSPKQSTLKLEDDLRAFADKYRQVIDAGYVVCIPDNAMGLLAFQGIELIDELELPAPPLQVSVHLNTFHTKKEFDGMLGRAAAVGLRHLLVISGDGSPRLPKLSGKDLGYDVAAVTSVELLKYIHREYSGAFEIGVAFNPYEPREHEMDKLRRKVDAGAAFITTQPIIEADPCIETLQQFGLPVVVEAWMSKKLHLLSDCVGYEIPEDTPYDPMANLEALIRNYPGCGFYLAICGFKTQFPHLGQLWN
jgi:methylenetetrahydrofolate reductase (NADPH)